MQGKTHVAVGITLGVIFANPANLFELAATVGTSYFGSIVSDLDVDSNRDSKATYLCRKTLIPVIIGAVAITFVAELITKGMVTNYITSHESLYAAIIAFFLFIALCRFGATQKHRTFLHSIPGGILLSACAYFIWPYLLFPFAIGYVSHVALDLLNYKKVSLFYPSHIGKCCLRICEGSGKTDNALHALFTPLWMVLVALRAYMVCKGIVSWMDLF